MTDATQEQARKKDKLLVLRVRDFERDVSVDVLIPLSAIQELIRPSNLYSFSGREYITKESSVSLDIPASDKHPWTSF